MNAIITEQSTLPTSFCNGEVVATNKGIQTEEIDSLSPTEEESVGTSKNDANNPSSPFPDENISKNIDLRCTKNNNKKTKSKEDETREERKQRRRDRLEARVLVFGASGLILGGIVGGPIGSAIAAPIAVVVVATTTKCGELRKDYIIKKKQASLRSS